MSFAHAPVSHRRQTFTSKSHDCPAPLERPDSGPARSPRSPTSTNSCQEQLLYSFFLLVGMRRETNAAVVAVDSWTGVSLFFFSFSFITAAHFTTKPHPRHHVLPFPISKTPGDTSGQSVLAAWCLSLCVPGFASTYLPRHAALQGERELNVSAPTGLRVLPIPFWAGLKTVAHTHAHANNSIPPDTHTLCSWLRLNTVAPISFKSIPWAVPECTHVNPLYLAYDQVLPSCYYAVYDIALLSYHIRRLCCNKAGAVEKHFRRNTKSRFVETTITLPHITNQPPRPPLQIEDPQNDPESSAAIAMLGTKSYCICH